MQLQTYASDNKISTQPSSHWYGQKISPLDTLRYLPIALTPDVRRESCNQLNQILINSTILYSLYKKPPWLTYNNTFHPLHLLMARHAKEHLKLINLLEERIYLLGGVAIDNSYYLAEATKNERPINDDKETTILLSGLLEAHEIVLSIIRQAIIVTAANGDSETNDLLKSTVLHTHELQTWFLEEHWAHEPLVSLSL